MKKNNFFSKSKIILSFICIILFALPFFWIKPGELELGGDSNRLFLYDPSSYLQFNSLYSVEPSGMGRVIPNQNLLPFILILQLFYTIFHSPYILICLLNSVKLVGSFLFIYLIVIEILKNHATEKKVVIADIAGILSGLFYTFSPSVGKPMQVALITHNQVFLNPMIFYFMLRFLQSHKNKYLWFALLTTFIFSPNFSLMSPAELFSFYPLAIVFLVLYTNIYLRKSLPWKKLLVGVLLFLGLHAFHLIPTTIYTFDPGSYFNLRVFDAETIQHEGVNYFNAILHYAMVTRSLFYSYGVPHAQWATFIGPLSIILGFLLCKKRQKDLTLLAAFFFITIFLESANILRIGVDFYRTLFYIPGFSMFRNFYGQWQWVQDFFYSLLLSYALFLILSKLKKRVVYSVSIVIAGLLMYSSWPFLSGQILRQPHRATDNVSMIIQMDPHYQQALSFFKNRPDESKIFDFPFTEFSYQLVPGLNRGAYIGVSPISYLTGRKDFSGQQILYPFSDVFLNLIKEKNYTAIKRLFGLLNVRYIFYIADPRAYSDFFPEIPFTLLLKVLPDSQSLANFVPKIVDEKIFQQGNYQIYYSDNDYYLPRFYVPTTIVPYGQKNDWLSQNTSFYVNTRQTDPRIGYIQKALCTKIYSTSDCKQGEIKTRDTVPIISFQRINPTKYKVIVSEASGPFMLVFSEQFHKDWKAFISDQKQERHTTQASYFNGSIRESYHENIFLNTNTFETMRMRSLPEKQHVMINGYANAWYITSNDTGGKTNYELIIEMTGQRIFYFSLAFSVVSFMLFLIWGAKLVLSKK